MSRDLDRQVAEWVMGWRFLKPFWVNDANQQCAPEDWSPSTDPVAMLQVIARMRKLGYTIILGDDLTDGWAWVVNFHKDDLTVAEEVGKTLPKVVCLAALFALRPTEAGG